MRIERITQRYRNDFHWIGKCEHCDKEERYGDGYADEFYCLRVVPSRHCPSCGLNSYGVPADQSKETSTTAQAPAA